MTLFNRKRKETEGRWRARCPVQEPRPSPATPLNSPETAAQFKRNHAKGFDICSDMFCKSAPVAAGGDDLAPPSGPSDWLRDPNCPQEGETSRPSCQDGPPLEACKGGSAAP